MPVQAGALVAAIQRTPLDVDAIAAARLWPPREHDPGW
jgi:hypothetical protein